MARAVAGATRTTRPASSARAPLSGTTRMSRWLTRSSGRSVIRIPVTSVRRRPSVSTRISAWSRMS